MLSYNNDTKLKEKFVKEIEWHQKQDKFLQGTYSEGQGENFKGCAVGCSIKSLNKLNGTTIKTNDHKAYEKYLGLPEWLARLEDTIFEGLAPEEAKKWPLRFSKAVPVGVDVKPVKYKFIIYLMKENIARVKKLDIDKDLKKQIVSAIKGSMEVNQNALDTGIWDEAATEAATEAAWAAEAAAWAAEAAARAAARAAAWAARAAAWAATEAAWAATEAATEAAAYKKHANKLIKLLKECDDRPTK